MIKSLFYIQALWVLFACTSKEKSIETESSTTYTAISSHPDSLKEDSTFRGIIQTTGLRAEEKQSLGLKHSDYQIVGEKSYFLESRINLEQYWGNCVEVVGKLKEGWPLNDDQVNGQYTYDRGVILLDTLIVLDFKECEYNNKLTSIDQDFPREILKGTIERFIRPAPDISYDFRLVFTEPYIDNTHASGEPTAISSILLSGYDFEILEALEGAIDHNKPIEIEGYKEAGYAESTHFRVLRVKPDTLNLK